MADNRLVVLRAPEANPIPGETLDYGRAFDIPRVSPGVIAEWVDAARDAGLASNHTRRNYQDDIEDFEAWREGRQITARLIERYLRHRRSAAGRDLSPTYRRRILAALR